MGIITFFRSFEKVSTQPADALPQVQLRDVGNQGDVHVHQVFLKIKNNSSVPGKIAKKGANFKFEFFHIKVPQVRSSADRRGGRRRRIWRRIRILRRRLAWCFPVIIKILFLDKKCFPGASSYGVYGQTQYDNVEDDDEDGDDYDEDDEESEEEDDDKE